MKNPIFDTATTFVIFSRKIDAQRVTKALRDCNIIAGYRSNRGANEVFGYVPAAMTADGVRVLALRFFDATGSEGGFRGATVDSATVPGSTPVPSATQ